MSTGDSQRMAPLELAAVLGIAVFLALVHFFVPPSTQQSLAFDHDHFALHTLLTSAYIHTSNSHLLGNVVGYFLATLYAYTLCVAAGERRWFRRTFVVFLVVLPILVNLASYAIFDLQYPALSPTSRGFSGVVAGLGGFLLVALAVYVRNRYSGELGWTVGVSAFLVLMGIVDVTYASAVEPLVWGLVVLGIGLLGGRYLRRHDLDRSGLDRRWMIDVGAVVLVFAVLAYMIVSLFPAEIVENGNLTNIFAHAAGFWSGLLLSWLLVVFEDAE